MTLRWGWGANAGQNALVGSAAYQNRKQINIKIDQNFSSKHRIAGSWTHQVDNSTDPLRGWPDGLSGLTSRGPHTLTVERHVHIEFDPAQ